jgi:hypothetical protein
MAELQALHRAVWGDVSYERHLAETRLRARRGIGIALMAVGVVVTALGLAMTTLPGPDELAQRDVLPPGNVAPATRPAPTDRDRTITTVRPAPASTRAPVVTAATTTTAPRRPRSRSRTLARTGARTDALLVLGVALVAGGLTILRGKSTRKRTPAS